MHTRIAFLALVSLMMTGMPALAVHGEAYDAYGTATDGGVFLAEVHWSGYDGCWSGSSPCEVFTLAIKDVTGRIVASESFRGGWTANGPGAPGGTEILAYHAWAIGRDGFSQDSAHFDIVGFQWQQVSNGGTNKALMVYTGNYYSYSLQLVVPYTTPWPL